MGGFSEAQYLEATNKVKTKNAELAGLIDDVWPAANVVLGKWYVPGFVKDAIRWCAEKIVELAKWIWEKIVDCLQGVAMPIILFKHAWDWQDLRGDASTVAGQLDAEALGAARKWEGPAAEAYKKVIPPQNKAATQIGTVAKNTAVSLTVCAAAGLAFYVALGVILVKFIAAMVTAIAALGSAVFSWAGAAIIVEEAGVNSGLIIAAVSALSAALGAQASQMSSLHGDAVDNAFFPGGHWPKAATNGGDFGVD